MPLEIPQTTEEQAAAVLAQQIIQRSCQQAQDIATVLANGRPALPAIPPRQMNNGQINPGRPEIPAISPEALQAALGDNYAILLSARNLLLGA